MKVQLLLVVAYLGACTAFSPTFVIQGPASTRLSVSAQRNTLPLRGETVRGRAGLAGTCMMAEKKTWKSMEDMLENSDKPILVDFYATWCGPCVLMARELATLSNDPEVKDKLMIVKIDTEKYPVIATKYKIEALPTVVLFKEGKPIERFEGVVMASQMKQLVMSKI